MTKKWGVRSLGAGGGGKIVSRGRKFWFPRPGLKGT